MASTEPEERLTEVDIPKLPLYLAFGVIFATAISLFLLPSAYLVLEDLRGLRARREGRMVLGLVDEKRESRDPRWVG